jgi:8-oxo-dGTP diphosphatase
MDNVIAAGVLVQERRPGGRYLLIKRRMDGFWSVPGGYREEGEDPRNTALQEFEEETGVSLDGRVARTGYIPTADQRGMFALYRGEVEEAFPIAEDEDEITAWGWFVPSGLPEPLYPGLDFFLED